MKREDFFTIMDCVSEEDAAEMMRYCRSEQFPDREEEIVMTKFTEHAEKESRRGKGIAAAVAAVLVCANIAGGVYLLRNSNVPSETVSNAGASMQTDAVEVVTAPVQTETEPVTTEPETVEAPQYVQLMQEYFTNLNGQPCTYDFTGLGQDYNIVYEYPDYTVTFKSMVGCDWVVYYFYDIKPQDTSEPDYLTWRIRGDRANAGELIAFKDGNVNFAFINDKIAPLNGKQDYALMDGVWHMVGTIINSTDKPFFNGENSGMLITNKTSDKLKDQQQAIPFTFETREFPLHEIAAPEITLDLPADTDKFTLETANQHITAFRKWTNAHPLTRCAETPFGTYYVSDTYTDGIDHGTSEGIPMELLSINGRMFEKESRAGFKERGGAVMNEEPRGNVYLFDAHTLQ